MFFEQEILCFNILDVFRLNQKNVSMSNTGRNFGALSFRFHADTVLKTKTEEYHVGDNFISYIPARLDYSRTATTDELIVIHFDTTTYHTNSIECFKPDYPDILAQLFRDTADCWNKKEPG